MKTFEAQIAQMKSLFTGNLMLPEVDSAAS